MSAVAPPATVVRVDGLTLALRTGFVVLVPLVALMKRPPIAAMS